MFTDELLNDGSRAEIRKWTDFTSWHGFPFSQHHRVPTAWLDFASPGSASRPKPVPADSVAKLLVEHGINCAILNACESARADQGLRANLALTFLEKGVGNVLAMSYKFPSSVTESFFSVFYQGLFCQGLPMSTAAAEARKHLREHGLRKSRFGLELQVQDWFIPVSYLSYPDVLFDSKTLQASDSITPGKAVQKTSARAKRITGRDFDLLRLEQTVTEANLVLIHGAAGVGKSAFVEYSLDLWRDTQYFDKFSMVNMLACAADKELTGSKVVTRIANDLKVPGSFLIADGLAARADLSDPLESWKRAVVVLDGVDHIFNNVFNEGFKPVAEALASLLRNLTSPEFASKTGKQLTVILTSRLGKEWWEARCPPPLVTPHYFALDGLELSAAITFAESLLQPRDSIDKRGSRETDFLVHTVNLLQRNPLAIKIALPTAVAASTSIKDTFRAIHVGELHLDYAPLMYTADYALVLTLKEVYERFPEYQDTLCSLADFWMEGPLVLHDYIRRLAAYSGLSQVYNMSPLVDTLNEVGVWRVSKQDKVEWLHPVFTLYLRQCRRTHVYKGAPLWAKGIMKVADFLDSHKREHPFGSTASLQIRIPRHFVSAVGHRGTAEFMTDILMGFVQVSDSAAPQSMQRMRGSFFNLLAVMDMICDDESVIPLELWPRDFISMFLSGSRLALSAPELDLLTGYVETALDAFQQKIGGFAVHPDFQVFIFNLVVHLFVSTLLSGIMSNPAAIEQLVARALAIVEASEGKYGPMVDDKLMWKAMVYRCQAVFLLVVKDEPGADAAWEHMKSIELEYFGPSAFEQSASSSPIPASGQQPFGLDAMQELLGPDPFSSKLRNTTASWVPVRHAAWPWLKEKVLVQGNTQAINQLYLPGIENAFENMVDTFREGGWTGLEHWQRYFPPRNDFEGYLRRAEDPEELLAELEGGLGRGDWKVAAQAHQMLAKKAGAEMKMDLVMFHLGQLSEILREADPENEVTKRVDGAMAVTKMAIDVGRRGYVVDRDFLKMVDALEEAGMDIRSIARVQGWPDEAVQFILDAAERERNRLGWLTEEMVGALVASLGPPAATQGSDDATAESDINQDEGTSKVSDR